VKTNCPFYNKKTTVVIPCNSEIQNLPHVLPSWFFQIDNKAQVVIVDFSEKSSASIIKTVCDRNQKTFSMYLDSDCDCVYYKMPFCSSDDNIGPIINNIETDVLVVADSSTIPKAYTLDMAFSILDQNNFLVSKSSIFLPKQQDLFLIEGQSAKEIVESLSNYLLKKGKKRIEKIELEVGYGLSGKKCSIFMPCMGREEYAKQSVPQWLSQIYPNIQFVFIDYSSNENMEPFLSGLCSEYGLKFCVFDESYDQDCDVVLIRVNGMKFFNISHAYNYAIKRIKPEIVCAVCCDSCPRDYFIELAMSVVNHETLVQCWWGIDVLTYKNWEKLNGHQEFIAGWGGEDDDFRERAVLMGLKLCILPRRLLYHIPQHITEKTKNRQVQDLRLSSHINMTRFLDYRAKFGYCGNYRLETGKDEPISFLGEDEKTVQIACCTFEDKLPIADFPECVQYDDETGVFHVVLSDNKNLEWGIWHTWAQYSRPKYHEVLRIIKNEESSIQSAILRFARDASELPANPEFIWRPYH